MAKNDRIKPAILDAIIESLSGVMAAYRVKARLAGQTTIHVRVTLSELRKLVKSRLDGLRGAWLEPNFVAPSKVELRDIWLPMLKEQFGDAIRSDGTIELDVEVPPPRKAHAR